MQLPIYIWKRLFETNQMVPNMAGFNEVENMMTSFLVFDTFIFSGVAVLSDKSVTSGVGKGQ